MLFMFCYLEFPLTQIRHERLQSLYTVQAANKPNSVSNAGCPGLDNGHSSPDAGCRASLATYPGARTGRSQTLPYLVLHRVGFTKLPRSPGELVRSYRTFSPLPRLNAGRYTFCCTFLHVAATPRYGAPCPMVFGLSSGFFNNPATVWAARTVFICHPYNR